MKLSVIIPCKNEEGNVKNIYDKLSETLKKIDYELIYIDDGSTDKTFEILKNIYSIDKKRIRVISFSRNFKKEAAIYAGISKSSGEYTCIIDGDLQQNPAYLLQMLDYLETNPDYDQVAMVMSKRVKENWVAVIGKKCFYKLIDLISDVRFVSGASDFRMFRTNIKDAIVSLGENNRFSKGIFSWVGFKTHYMPYDVELRTSGQTKFNLKASFQYAFDGILGFSTKPLRIATYLGIICSFFAFIYFICIIASNIVNGVDGSGYSSLMCVILLLGGVQLITIGILGEYLAKAYLETKKRPIYISKEELGFKK